MHVVYLVEWAYNVMVRQYAKRIDIAVNHAILWVEISDEYIYINAKVLCIFASQGLRSAPLLSTLGRLSQNFVIPAYRPLADL